MSRLRPTVLIADDDPGIQAAVSRWLASWCEVVGVVADTESLLEAVVRLRPDVVLLDFSLAGHLSGLESCRRIRATAPGVNVVAFTAATDPDLKRLMNDAGAAGFVWKLQAATDLWPTIQAVVERQPAPDDGHQA